MSLLSSAVNVDNLLGVWGYHRDWWAWWMVCWAISVLAYLTNPSPATFRTHLTSLSFHTHLRRLSSSSHTDSHREQTSKTPPPQTGSHILSFSNRISLSVRTPPFTLRSYYFFSTAHMSSIPPPKGVPTDVAGRTAGAEFMPGGEGAVWVGAFGRWYAWKWDEEDDIEEERVARLKQGVLAMEVEDDDDDKDVTSSTASVTSPETDVVITTSPTARSRQPRPSKRSSRPGQTRPSPPSLASLRSKAETSQSLASPPLSPVLASPSTTLAEPDIEGFYSTRSDKPGLPFHVPRTTSSSSPSSSPLVSELKLQLEELETSAHDSEVRLQNELETLRERKREEDAFRAELKVKTKALEEQKRIAELGRVEAERELGARKAVMRRANEKVEKLRDEIGQIERKELDVEERKQRKARERKEKEKKLRGDVERKMEELRDVEQGIEKVLAKVAGLEKTIDVRRDMLNSRRHELAARNMGFAAGSGAFRRGGAGLGGPYNYGGQPDSRPGSIRSGQFDLHAGFDPSSTPSSPSLAYQPYDIPAHPDAAFYGGQQRTVPVTQHGFFEHRRQHRAEGSAHSPLDGPGIAHGTYPDGDAPSAFQPFDFDSYPLEGLDANGDYPGTVKPHRPQLSLPLQYLDSGLLAGTNSPGNDGPLSPMTPHQASLIPSQLFQMLDEDDEDDYVLAPEHLQSPTRGASDPRAWGGLGLEVDESLGRPRHSISPPLVSPESEYTHSSPIQANYPFALGSGVWDSFDSRLSPQEDDDLPRGGLSLNPDAKAFAFQPRSAKSSITSPTVTHRARTVSSDMDAPPAKSRMDFASSSNATTSSMSMHLAPASTLSYDWQRTVPRVASTQPASMLFNPFDDDDELLGPLKR